MTIGHLPGGPYLKPSGRPNTARSDPTNVEDLAEPTRSRVRQLIADCPFTLYLVSGYRDPGRQWDLRRDRVGWANIWNYPPRGNPTTAVPARWNAATGRWEGGSKHQSGMAADLGGSERGMQWMHDNRERYGLAKTVPGERWHLEPDKVDIYTKRRHDNPTALITPIPPPIPKDWLTMASEEDVRRLLREELKRALTGADLTPFTMKAKGPTHRHVRSGQVWYIDPSAGTAWRPKSANTDKGSKAWRARLDSLIMFGGVRNLEATPVPCEMIAAYRPITTD